MPEDFYFYFLNAVFRHKHELHTNCLRAVAVVAASMSDPLDPLLQTFVVRPALKIKNFQKASSAKIPRKIASFLHFDMSSEAIRIHLESKSSMTVNWQ